MMNTKMEQRCNLEKSATASKDDIDAVKNGTSLTSRSPSGIEGQAWVEKFKTMCLSYRCSTDSLTNLMTYYARNIRTNVNECQTKPLKAEKLKDFISGTLLFFLYCYRAQGEDSDCTAYMDIMSDLLAMYIDMELKASKRTTEAHSNISARLTSYLYVCLDNSTEHLLDTLLKVQFMSSTYLQILDPLIEKILRLVPKNPTNGTTYVRYFLLYRIWKRINKDPQVKNQINAKARQSMRSSPSKLSEYLINNVLPKVPINQKINTEILLLQKFDLEKSCENFIKFTRDTKNSLNAQLSESTEPEDNLPDNSNDKNKSQKISNNSNSILNFRKFNNSRAKILTRRVSKKLGEVVLIDLTNDETSAKVLKPKKKTEKRLSWLQEIAKRKTPVINMIKEDNSTEDMKKLDLSLFITNEPTMLPEDHQQPQESETSVLSVGNLRLDKKCDDTLPISSVESNEPEVNDEINSSKYSILKKSIDNKIEMEISPLKSEIKVQMEVHNELDIKTTEINELKNDVCENLKNEIIDDTKSSSTNLGNEYQRDTVLHINQNIQSNNDDNSGSSMKLRNVEFQEHHIDGLSLLASVSQRVSHLSTDSITANTNNVREIIKVKDPKSLTTIFNNSESNIENCDAINTESMSNSIIEMYPDDDIDKVALNVEVSSSEDVYHPQTIDNLQNEGVNECLSTLVDSSIHSEKEETNVILNGETIFLLQKSPNSNLYIINKAVENREDEDCNNDKNLQLGNVDENNYSYEIYDKLYRINQSNVGQAFDDTRRSSQKNKLTTAKDCTRVSIDHKKNEINKKTNNLEIKSPRRHRIKQEYDTCPSDLVDSHGLHIPPTSIYRSNYPTSELYISCRQNCASVTCSLPVNHSTKSIHPISNSSRCTCLNCRYDIVTHCTQCIIPPSDTKQNASIDGSSYYIEIQPAAVIKDCKAKHDADVKVFDDKTICKMEIDEVINDNKQGTFLKSEVNSKLPLKKRFSMMSSSFENVNVKTENQSINYPNTPMLSIAALETNTNNSQLSNKIRNNEDYRNDSIHGFHFTEDAKRKRTGITTNGKNKIRKTCTDSGQISRPSKKVQEPKSPSKNSKRQTRLSQRKVPRVNYSYPDQEIECNPSVESKRKRKKNNR